MENISFLQNPATHHFLVNALFAECCCFIYCRRKQKMLSVKHTIDSWHLFRSAWYKSLHICMQINSLRWKNRLDRRAFWHCVCVCHIFVSFHLPTIKIGKGYTKMTVTGCYSSMIVKLSIIFFVGTIASTWKWE